MLKTLVDLLPQLPALLRDEGQWQSLWIDYHKPYVERIWIPYNDYRINIHRIHPCEAKDSLIHPHEWPAAMKIISGTYHEKWQYVDTGSPRDLGTHVRVTGSIYTMHDPALAHAIYMDAPVLSIMLTGTPWRGQRVRAPYTLQPLSPQKKNALMQDAYHALTQPSS